MRLAFLLVKRDTRESSLVSHAVPALPFSHSFRCTIQILRHETGLDEGCQ